MRHIGIVPTEQQAQRFCDFLLTETIEAQAEREDDQWAVWVRDEDQVERAKAALSEFLTDPQASRYDDATGKASKRREEDRRRRAQSAKNTYDVRRDVWNRPATQRMPVTVGLVLVCVAIGMVTQLGAVAPAARSGKPGLGPAVYGALTFQDPATRGDGWASIRSGQVWRLFTPALLHLSLMHIVFNMMCLYGFGGQIEVRQGWLLLVLLILITGIAGNVGQCLFQGPNFGGMSGAVYGLFGYMVIRQRVAPQDGLQVSSQTVFILVMWLALGFAGTLGDRIANHAHLFGMLMGGLLAFLIPPRWMRVRR